MMGFSGQPIDPVFQKFIVDTVNKAVEQSNAGNFDSAAFTVMIVLVALSGAMFFFMQRRTLRNLDQNNQTMIALVQKSTEAITASKMCNEEFRRDISEFNGRVEGLSQSVNNLAGEVNRCPTQKSPIDRN